MTLLAGPDSGPEVVGKAPGRIGRGGRAAAVFALTSPVVLAYCVFVMFSGATPLNIGAAALVALLWLMFLRVPVGMALGGVGLLGLWAVTGSTNGAINSLHDVAWSSANSWTLSVIPMFVLMGILLERSGLGADIYRAVRAMVGRTPAGLAVSTNFAGAAMGAASGSTVGIVYSLGRTGIPEMVKAGYDRRFAAGAVLMAGTGGQLIPPSILLVIYAGIAQVPVGQQLMAGMLPGILLHVLYAVAMVAIVLTIPRLAPPRGGERQPWKERLRESAGIWPVVVLVGVVLGGLYSGTFTPTEAGAFGAVAAALMVLSTKGFGMLRSSVGGAIHSTVVTSGSIFLIIIGGSIFGRFMALSGIPKVFTEYLQDANVGAVGFMLLVLVLYLVLGTFMDPVPMMLITVPILLPIAMTLDVDPMVFGVFAVLMGELAVLTPPVGILLYIVHRIAKDAGVPMTLGEVIQGIAWFYPITIAFALTIVFFPDYVLWLPGLMK
ncbi:TRAP transporter large permease [Nocardioides houyundeii]|uniref:TRAP transporter large permease n=1 Tax=Nocardioides houyundeii TaxID=2045452 RepID=UPI000C7941B0|nr:TRAP transporter large permease [Nocardioides houyundeii]